MSDPSPELLKKLILSVGTHKGERPLSPVEVAQGLSALRRSGRTPKDIAGMLHLSGPTMLGRFDRLLSLAPGIRHIVSWGGTPSSITFAAACEIARLGQPDQEKLADAILTHSMGKGEVIQIIQRHQRSGKPITSCIEEICQLRPQVVRKYVFIGKLISEALRERSATLSQANRDLWLSTAAANVLPHDVRWGGRLGTERFTLVGDESLSRAVRSLMPDFETAINGALSQCQ